MPYVRHRDRMVQESVFEDLQNTLIACRWMPGTTTRPVRPPAGGAPTIITTSSSQVLKIVGVKADGSPAPVVLIDHFPESGGATVDKEAAVGSDANTTAPNTLAIDEGQPGDSELMELGSDDVEQPYTFTLAFYANSDSVAKAMLNDLRDRYAGKIVAPELIALYDYNTDPDQVICNMEVDGFRYTRNVETVTPTEVHLYFAELAITDFVEE